MRFLLLVAACCSFFTGSSERSAPDAHFRGSLDVAVDTQQDALELVSDFVLEK